MLKELKLNNFRNYQDSSFGLQEKNLICGKNGVGKTNLLEAVHLLCVGKSFRSLKNRDFLKDKSRPASIFARFRENGQKVTEISQSLILKSSKTNFEPQKGFYRDGKKIQTLKLFGRFPAVLFAPEELRMVWGSPKDRRAILDLLVTQIKPNHASKLLNFSKVLRQRNKLLFYVNIGKSKPAELDFWDNEFINLASEIISARDKAVKELAGLIKSYYRDISGAKDSLEMLIASSGEIDHKELSKKRIAELLGARLKNNLDYDVKTSNTNIGPHRDEPKLLLNNAELASYGSRGEGRTAVLALKFAQKEMLQKKLDKKCILLFDDAFSELDRGRVDYLLENIGEEQVIFTATFIPKKLQNYNIINLAN